MASKRTTKSPAASKARKPAKPATAKTKATRAQPASERKIVGDQALAKHYSVTSKSIYNWRIEGMPAKKLPGNKFAYDLDETDPWVKEKREATAQDKELQELRREKERTKVRIEKARADSAERRNELDEGHILDRDTYELFMAEVIQETRDAILRVPSFFYNHLCKKCQGKKQELVDQLEEALIRLATKLAEGPPDDE